MEIRQKGRCGKSSTAGCGNLPANSLMKIDYWCDVACPFCYIGETNMKKALRALHLQNPPELEFHTFELNPGAPKFPEGTGEDAERPMTPQESFHRIDSIDAAGKAAGLDMRYGKSLRANTRDAHRLIKMAHELGGITLADKVAENLYRACFTEHRNLSEPEVLLEIGEKNGLGREEVEQMLNSEKYLEEVLHDEHEAQAMNVISVPFFLVDNKYAFTGALSAEQMTVILKKIMEDAIPGSPQAG